MSRARQSRHPTLSLPFSERAILPDTPHLTTYLLRLMATKKTNLCLSADVQSTSQLFEVAEECGDSICILKTHSDIIYDFGERTIQGLTEIAARKKFLVFEDRKFGDIGSTVQMQYGAGSHRIASWASIINAHIFPGPAIITALKSAAFSAVAAYNSTFTTEITGGRAAQSNGYFDSPDEHSSSDCDDEEQSDEEDSDEDSEEDDSDDDSSDDDAPAPKNHSYPPRRPSHASPTSRAPVPFDHRKSSIVSISTTISSSTEYVSPPGSSASTPLGAVFDQQPPLSRGLLLLAQMSSEDNLFTPTYTHHCVDLARQHKDFVLGFIAQESLNVAPADNFLTMCPGISLPPSAQTAAAAISGRSTSVGSRLQTQTAPSRSAVASRQGPQSRGSVPSASKTGSAAGVVGQGDGLGQQYHTPRHAVLEKGVDVIIVGRGILKAEDRGLEAERFRGEGWRALMERCGGRT